MNARPELDPRAEASVVRPVPQSSACAAWRLPGRSRGTPHEACSQVVRKCRQWGLPAETTDDLAQVAVIDHGRSAESPAESMPDDEHGRGHVLVKSLADHFVCRAAHHGMVAWASVALSATAVTHGISRNDHDS
ncbi:hypothetical protein AB0F77_25975 [Streptomyces sp. NPDC026672]|uniref:hypothetical protein n=1 Tax=unclassified Streptomyces TaxID=2593676 RepID=UPI003408E96D